MVPRRALSFARGSKLVGLRLAYETVESRDSSDLRPYPTSVSCRSASRVALIMCAQRRSVITISQYGTATESAEISVQSCCSQGWVRSRCFQ